MAYISQETKSTLTPAIKTICKKYGIVATVAIGPNNRTLILNVRRGAIDFATNANDTVANNLQTSSKFGNQYSGIALEFLQAVHAAMMVGNRNNSDIENEYYDIGWFTTINIGTQTSPYQYIQKTVL